MKKVFIFLALCALAFLPFFFAEAASATSTACSSTTTLCLPNPLTSNTFEDLIETIINWLLIITGPIVALLVVFAGARIAFSGGSAEQVKGARDMIIYALIGYTVIIVAKVLVGVIKGLFG